MVCIGILALQGAFAKHVQMMNSLGVKTCEVRKEADLGQCDGLIMPGGESTAMIRLLRQGNFIAKLAAYGEQHPVFGTCAGLILMAQEIIDEPPHPLGWLAIAIERNAFGRQVESFQASLDFQLEGHYYPFPALFIRAPRIRSYDLQQVEVLARYENEPVLVKQGHFLGSTFHPELTNNSSIHAYFLDLVKKNI